MRSCFVEKGMISPSLTSRHPAHRIKRIKSMFVPPVSCYLPSPALGQTPGDLLSSSLQRELYTEDVHKKIYNLISI